MNERPNRVILIIGKRGSGKTFKTKKLIDKSKLRTLIIDTFDHESYRDYRRISPQMIDDEVWKSGTVRCYGYPFSQIFNQISTKLSNALIIFEDCTKYLKHPLPEEVKNFIVDSKQKNLDLIFMFHGFGFVMPDLFRLADIILLFKVNENIDTYRSKIPNFEEVKSNYLMLQNKKNKYANASIRIN